MMSSSVNEMDKKPHCPGGDGVNYDMHLEHPYVCKKQFGAAFC